MKITFIGLGIMGSRMAANMRKHNVSLTVYNRSKESVDKLADLGATPAGSTKEAVADADVVFSMLADPGAVSAVMLGEGGALTNMKKGAIWVDCSTVNPTFSMHCMARANESGIQFLDGPVAGTLPHAENAQLTFFVGGDKETLGKVKPYLEMMGQGVLHIGENGKGTAYKMLINMMLAQSMVMFSESVLLGQKMGIDKDFLLEALPKAPVTAPFLQFKTGMIRDNDYPVMFPLELMHKDMHLATSSAFEYGQPLPMANAAKEVFAAAKQAGLGRADFAGVYQYLETQS